MVTARSFWVLTGVIPLLWLLPAAPSWAGPVGYTFQTVDFPSAVQFDQVSAINDAGTLVGYYGNPQNNNSSYVATSNGQGGYSFTTYNAPNADSTFINAVNNSGQIAGSVEVNSVFSGFSGSTTTSAVTAVEVPNSTYTFAFGINNANAIVGRYSVITPTSGSVSGFLTTDNGQTFTTLRDPLAPNDTEAFGINDRGTIAGIYRSADFNFHGFLATPGTGGAYGYTTIDVPGATSTFLRAINDLGQLVGTYDDSFGMSHSFLATLSGSSYIYQTLDDPLGARGTSILGINNLGQVVGSYTDANNVQHGFVANPNAVPEPASLILTALSGGLICGWDRLRGRAGPLRSARGLDHSV